MNPAITFEPCDVLDRIEEILVDSGNEELPDIFNKTFWQDGKEDTDTGMWAWERVMVEATLEGFNGEMPKINEEEKLVKVLQRFLRKYFYRDWLFAHVTHL